MFDRIEKLKAEWTDKFVVIDSPAPELSRFAHTSGTVKTVNMNGRCLVQFDQFNNIGWYDIDPSALKIVPEPLPKPVVEKAKPAAAAKPAPAAKPAAAKPAAGTPGAAKPAKAAKPKLSTADILAAARGAKAAAAAPAKEAVPGPAVPDPGSEPEADEPPAVVAPAAKAAKPAAGPLPTTTAEKIAWCRAHTAKG